MRVMGLVTTAVVHLRLTACVLIFGVSATFACLTFAVLAALQMDKLTACSQVGLYKTPVVVLDFASLYPSLFRAHNMCYTTLLHEEDAKALPPEKVFTAPTGFSFVKREVRRGMLPAILAALIEVMASSIRLGSDLLTHA